MTNADQTADPGAMYRDSKPSLDAALRAFEDETRAVVNANVADAYVTGRVKGARSLIRKLREDRRNPRAWTSIRDKVGVRVICSTKKDCATANEVLGGRWTLLDRKVKKAGPDKLFYPGIHLIVEDPGIVDQNGDSIPCEIQIRTRAQDAWSVVSHKLQYKGLVKPPRRMRRVINRLTVVVEMFDDDIHRLFKKRAKLPSYATAVALEKAELAYERVTGDPNDGASDLTMMNTLLGAYADSERPEFGNLIDLFCDEERAVLARLIADHQPILDTYVDSRDWLYSQPEVIAVLERASNRPFLLANAIRDTDLEDVVRRTCISAGKPLPD